MYRRYLFFRRCRLTNQKLSSTAHWATDRVQVLKVNETAKTEMKVCLILCIGIGVSYETREVGVEWN